MKVGICGASGFVGTHLTEYLTAHHHQVIPLYRGLLKEEAFQQLVEMVEDCDVLINLAGAPIHKRWTARYKRELYKSRIHTTSRLVLALKAAKVKPALFISTSAVGYYPSRGSYDERDEIIADGFLAALCRNWEKKAQNCPSVVRLAIIRLGVVLAPDGGAMREMTTPLLQTKISAVLGSGKQPFPWISMQDVCGAITFLMEHPQATGIYNLVSPQQITQNYLAHALARAYNAWATLPVPGFLIRCLFGERGKTLLEGQRVSPSRLLDAGFRFTEPTVEQVLKLPDIQP